MTVTITGGQAFAAEAPIMGGRSDVAGVAVGGAVEAPRLYSVAEIAALPQLTLPLNRGPGSARTVSGASLETLVASVDPRLPPGKNAQLREFITVTGAGERSVTVEWASWTRASATIRRY